MKTKTTRTGSATVNAAKSWRYRNFDAFGRATTVTAPDEEVTTLSYSGERSQLATVQVQTDDGLESHTTTTLRDSLGRVARVITTEHVTNYSYDPNGRMVEASRVVDSTTTQTRTYGYDARGYLLSASLPEADYTYKPDAMGLSRRMTDGLHDLTWAYDGNGRPTSLSSTNGGTVWKTWTYGTANSGTSDENKEKGRLIEATRYNQPPVGEPVLIVESYEYTQGTAGTSQLERQVQWPNRSGNNQYGPTFRTTFGYDKLGNLDSLGYPICVTNSTPDEGIPCGGSDDLPAAAHTATWSYSRGLMTSASSSHGMSASFTYHPNLQLSTATFGNGVVGTYAQGTDGMARPSQRTFKDSNEIVLFDTGSYGYDGAGNISAIGNDAYTYDGAGRLRSATVKQAGIGRYEKYQYDAADNMTQIENDVIYGNTRTFQIDAATNRLERFGTGTADWTYDDAGNLVSAASGQFTFGWDDLNMQTRHREGGVDYISVYGPGDYRVWLEDTSSGIKHWTSRSPDGQILREFEVTANGAAWAHVRDYIYGAEGAVGTVERDGGQRYLHSDHLGTTRLLTTSAGTALKTRHYYPFGFEATADPPGTILLDGFESGDLLGWELGKDVLAIKFTGHQRDLHQNSDYMLGRQYLALANRFASADPARDGWNLYAYVGNDPLSYADPSGYARAAAYYANEINAKLYSEKNEVAYALAGEFGGLGSGAAMLTGAGFDLAIGFVDLFTVGADTGTAIGSGAGGLELAGAIAGDTLRFAGLLAAPVASGARRVASRRVVARLANRFGTSAERMGVLKRVIGPDGAINTSETVARQLARGGAREHIPSQSILDTIGSGTRVVDPQGVAGQFMYRSAASFNGSEGVLDVLVHETSGQIRHVLFRSGVR